MAPRVKGHRDTYDSIEDLAAVAVKHIRKGTVKYLKADDMDHNFTSVHSLSELESLAVDGWMAEVPNAMAIAESAVAMAERDVDMPIFESHFDVAGADVDVPRYLSGEIENMVDYRLAVAPRSGNIITLCAAVSVSWAVSTKAIKRRGHAVVALAFALSKLGYNIEIWADMTSGKDSTRVLVKSANDDLDEARIMFALAHPGMMRGLCMPAMHEYPADAQARCSVGGSYGSVDNPKEDLPDGTIYLPAVRSDRDVPNADLALIGYLRELGILD